MTQLTQIDDRVAAIAWSPTSKAPDVVVLGTKDSGGKIGFDDYGGQLEFFNLKLTSSSSSEGNSVPQLLGSSQTSSRFSSIAWMSYGSGGGNEGGDIASSTTGSQHPAGLVVGGMSDGTIQIWDPIRIINNSTGAADTANTLKPLAIVPKRPHGDAVTALESCPHIASKESKWLAIGLSSGEFAVLSLENPNQPMIEFSSFDSGESSKGAPITNLSWNSSVSYIVASATADGFVTVWDLRQRKKWCEIRCEPGLPVNDVVWNPSEGLHMLTASGDDRNPQLKLWDLRSSTSMPVATLEGHTKGALSLSWCPHDPTLLVSCGKEKETLLWDLNAMKCLGEISSGTDPSHQENNNYGQQDGFGGGGGGQQSNGFYNRNLDHSNQLRFDIQWSPHRRGVISVCSLDRKVQVHSVLSVLRLSARAPGWLRSGAQSSTGFGGTLLSTSSLHRGVTVDRIVEQPVLLQEVLELERALTNQNFSSYCSQKALDAAKDGDGSEAQIWGFMQIMFDENSRGEILNYLGFDKESFDTESIMSELGGENGSSSGKSAAIHAHRPISHSTMTPKAEELVQKMLLVGDFESAVECCMKGGNFADALILASCGGGELWSKTQEAYLSKETSKRPYLSILGAVLNNQLEDFITKTDPAKWHETLAFLSTYATADDYEERCRALGEKVEKAGDAASATLCYICARDLDKASQYWKQLYEESVSSPSSSSSSLLIRSTHDVLTLHRLIEKIAIFMCIPNMKANTIHEDIGFSHLFNMYAKILADQGLVDQASNYCRPSNSQEGAELAYLLYYCGIGESTKRNMGKSQPEFPFQIQQQVSKAKASSTTTTTTMANASTNNEEQLLPGWQALQDPSTGMTYYANTSTGESKWEKPVAPTPAPAPAPAPLPVATQSYSQPATVNTQTSVPTQSAYRTAEPEQPRDQYTTTQYQTNTASASYAGQSFGQQNPTSTSQVGAAQFQSQSEQRPTTYQSDPSSFAPYNNNTQGQTQQSQADMSGETMNGTSMMTQTSTDASSTLGTPSRLASRYGDGFVSSSSHPKLAEQYGNVGTSNPYSVGARPGTAKVSGTPSKPPVSGTFDSSVVTQLNAEQQAIAGNCSSLLSTLNGCNLTFSEKKQLQEAEKSVTVLTKKMARGDVDAAVMAQLTSMSDALQHGNYQGAQAILTGLVNHFWSHHKDFLRGLKLLIQLCVKRL